MGFVTLAHKVAEAKKPVTGLLLSTIAEGSLVKLNEDGSPVEFYVAKHDYEPSLNGDGRTLLVRKDCYDVRAWDNSTSASVGSDIDLWLNGDYKALLDSDVLTAIGETTFYYTVGGGTAASQKKVTTRACSVFLLSLTEYGTSGSYSNVEGSELSISDLLIEAYVDGEIDEHWTRTVNNNYGDKAYSINPDGTDSRGSRSVDDELGSRPCFTLPSNSVFDEETLLFKEVS